MTMETALDMIGNVLSLPRTDRSYLAAKLIESLDEEREFSPEILDELESRATRAHSGETQTVSLNEVRGKIQQVLSK
jgi:putative addiction module component (TIGR02574 family)